MCTWHEISNSFFEKCVEKSITLVFFYFIAGYYTEQLKTCADVCLWLEKIDKEYAIYRPGFEANIVDGFWLLNYVNEEILEQYGVKNKKDRQKILSHIEKLKRELSA